MSITPKICLNMIVKNESLIMNRCLLSVLSIIDYVVITDTGSTDNTISIIEQFLQEKNIQGKVYQEPWKNFGYNRTNSIQNAKEFLQSIQENLENVFLLFIDADMKLVISPSFHKNDLIDKNIIQFIQKNCAIQYYNTRMCRSDIPITCKGVTHEYYDYPNQYKCYKLDKIYIDDIGDGGAKNDKFERDIKLLQQGLIDEPNSERYHFYLAQSYHCIQQFDKSIEYYKKRIDMGGWREEVYHSYLTIANMYKDSLRQWDNAFIHYMKAYQASGGVRAEPLMKIVEYYKDNKDYHSCFLFLEKLFKMKYPVDDVLFIDYHVYSYRPIYEFSIIAYYMNLKIDGLLATQYVILDKNDKIPNHVKDVTKKNVVFYIRKIPPTSIQRLQNISLFQYYNPSSSSFSLVSAENNQYQGVLRTVNYRINDKGQYLYPPHMNYIHTENYWVTLQKNNIQTQKLITISPNCYKEYSREYYSIQGLEDGRHVFYQDEIYISFTSFEYGKEPKASLVLTHMNKDTYEIDRIVHLKYEEHKIQKNWVPFVFQNKLCFVYSYSPFIILSVNPLTGDCEEVLHKNFNYDLSDLRGSASPIFLSHLNQYIIMTHEVAFCETRKYIHRFLLFDEEFNLLQISEPFYFQELFIEFSLSIMYNHITNEIIVPFSIKDNESFICKIPFHSIPWLPTNIKEYFSNLKNFS